MIKENTVTISFVGDIFPANLSYNRNCGVAALDFDDKHRKEYVKMIQNIIPSDNIFVGNLESPILSIDEFSKEQQFAGHPDFLKMLKEAGINVVSLANNHILEWKTEGLRSTESALNKHGIYYIGTIDGNGENKVVTIEKNGLRLAFLSYNDIDNAKYKKGVVCKYNKEQIIKDIQRVKTRNVDAIFLILHWGDEYIHRPSRKQIEAAHVFVDAGANFVICSHPHVVQPVEEYHDGLICYSLGNFIFDMTIPKASKTGMVVNLEISKNSFTHRERFIRLQKNFFPKVIADDQSVRDLLDTQKALMKDFQSEDYSEQYQKEKRRKRRNKRISEKILLIRNWSKYTPAIRQDFINIYKKKIFGHGNN